MGKQTDAPGAYNPGTHTMPGGFGGGFGNFMQTVGLQAPDSQNYYAAAEATAKSNRPDITTPFGSQRWTQDANGNWQMTTGLNGPLGHTADDLGLQAANAMRNPLDFSSLGDMPDPSKARQQAIDAAYSQATSRLDPRFEKQGEALRTQLINQGLDPNSEAARNANTQFSQQKNDAYSSAMNNAIMQGTQAADSYFNQGMQARQQGLSELLRQRSQPLQEMMALMGLTNMPNVAPGADYLGAAGMQGNYNLNAWNAQNQSRADTMSGLTQAGSSILPFLLL